MAVNNWIELTECTGHKKIMLNINKITAIGKIISGEDIYSSVITNNDREIYCEEKYEDIKKMLGAK
ncbi:hypothetical protein KAR91_20245 [Candidatus Pacearchaeota archaeon]|nr:hypothetical protein [Candidatus Pacearchaeota archaeon]